MIRQLVALMHADPDARHMARLACAVPYTAWLMHELDSAQERMAFVDPPVAMALAVRAWALLVPLFVHALYCWYAHRRDRR